MVQRPRNSVVSSLEKKLGAWFYTRAVMRRLVADLLGDHVGA